MGKVVSGRTFVVLVVGEVPVEVPEGQETAALLPGVQISLPMAGLVRSSAVLVTSKSSLDAIRACDAALAGARITT